jgi:hypothetical protein
MSPNEFSVIGAEPVIRDSVTVPRGGFLRIHDGRGTEVHVHQGLVWLTQDHDRKDRFLEAGDRFVLDRDGRVIAQAFSEAVVTLMSPAEGLAVRFEVVPAVVPHIRPAGTGLALQDTMPTHAGAYGVVDLAGAILSAARDALARGWFVLTRLTSPKTHLPGGHHG